MAPFEALYGWRYRSPIVWFKFSDVNTLGTNIVKKSQVKVCLIQDKLLESQSRQKEYANCNTMDMSFKLSEQMLLKVSPMKVLVWFGKRGKPSPWYIVPFKVLNNTGLQYSICICSRNTMRMVIISSNGTLFFQIIIFHMKRSRLQFLVEMFKNWESKRYGLWRYSGSIILSKNLLWKLRETSVATTYTCLRMQVISYFLLESFFYLIIWGWTTNKSIFHNDFYRHYD